ncbi:MAG: FAD-dependent thymidylate synthase [Waterburya sp.]
MQVKLFSSTHKPCQVMSLAARTCYFENDPLQDPLWKSLATEAEHWNWLVKACLSKGHYSPLEYSQYVFVATDIPMPTVVQIRTHRGLSMQVQSMRYTGRRMGLTEFYSNEQLFYTRTELSRDREGKAGTIPPEVYDKCVSELRQLYVKLCQEGIPNEVARDILPSSYTQNFILSCNLRELFHLFGMRSPKDAQLEVRQVMELMRKAVTQAIPEPIDWYMKHHWGKYKGSF